MCCILFIPKGVETPQIDLLKSVFIFNRDGVGFADTDGNFFRTLSFDKFTTEIKKRKVAADCIIHFRFATHGSVCVENCHPFRDEKTGVIFAHNGVLPIASKDNKTDSQIFFEEIFLPELDNSSFTDPILWDFVNNVRYGSRFAFMHGDNVHLCGDWYKYKDVYFSNLNWMRFRRFGH